MNSYNEKNFDVTDEEMRRILAEVDAKIARMSAEELEAAGEEAANDEKFYRFIRKYTPNQRKEHLRKNRYRVLWADITHRNWKRAIEHIKEIYF